MRTPAYYRRRTVARAATVVALTVGCLVIGYGFLICIIYVFDGVTGR